VNVLAFGRRNHAAAADQDAGDRAFHAAENPADDGADCRARADAGGLVIASLHDATLAARWADRVLLLHGNGRWQFGNAATILTDSNLSALYEVPVGELAWRGQRVFVSA